MVKINYLPNFLTGLRIILSFALLIIKPFSVAFFVVYLICGGTDILDGYIARKFNIATDFGARFDSFADSIFFLITIFIYAPLFKQKSWILIWIFLIFIIKLISLALGYLKFHKLSFLHTYMNKMSGFIFFMFPFIYIFLGVNKSAFFICTISIISAIEELLIILISKDINLDTKSAFMKNIFK